MSILSELAELRIVSSTLVRYGCGHEGPAVFFLTIYGQRFGPRSDMTHLHCGQCLIAELNDSTRCASCGKVILKGQSCHRRGSSDQKMLCCSSMECSSGPGENGLWDGRDFSEQPIGGRTGTMPEPRLMALRA